MALPSLGANLSRAPQTTELLVSHEITSNSLISFIEILQASPHLKILHFMIHEITLESMVTLTQALQRLHDLESFTLYGLHQITPEQAYLLAQTFDYWPHLKECALHWNLNSETAEILASTLKHHSLEQLRLIRLNGSIFSGIEISQLFQAQTHLKELHLHWYDKMPPDEGILLAQKLQDLPELEKLKLIPSPFKLKVFSTEESSALTQALQKLSHLKELSWIHAKIDPIHPEVHLEKLIFQANHFENSETQNLITILKNSPQLKVLHLGSNPLTLEDPRFVESLKNLSSLQELLLDHTCLNHHSAAALAAILKDLPQLKELDLSFNPFALEGIKVITPVLQTFSQLQFLNLAYISAHTEGTQLLANALTHLGSLKTFNFKSNTMGPAGAQALAKSLPHLQHLENLDLSFNALEPEGMSFLAESLTHLKKLKNLDLSFNELGPQGTQALASSLTNLKDLEILNLEANLLGSTGAQALVESLKDLSQLQILILDYNRLGILETHAFITALSSHRHIQLLSLLSNAFELQSIPQLIEEAKKILPNCTLHLSDLRGITRP